MIGYIEGKLMKKDEERILLLANQIGFEVMVPAFVMKTLESKSIGDEVSLYIYYQQTERQPKPVLIGFNLEEEKEFFQQFVSVEDIGPMKAVKALNISIHEIADAIENKDVDKLKNLKGIGARTAQKIIASLGGKVGGFVRVQKDEPIAYGTEHIIAQVLDVLVTQLGHKPADAKQLIAQAIKRNRLISTPEQLFDEVYRGNSIHGNE